MKNVIKHSIEDYKITRYDLLVGKHELQHYGHGGEELFEMVIYAEQNIGNIFKYLIENDNTDKIYKLVRKTHYSGGGNVFINFTDLNNLMEKILPR